MLYIFPLRIDIDMYVIHQEFFPRFRLLKRAGREVALQNIYIFSDRYTFTGFLVGRSSDQFHTVHI